MKRNLSVVLGTLILGWTASVYAAQPSPDYEHLKPLEWLIGDWVGEYTAPFDFDMVKKGDHVTSYASHRWVLNRSFLVQDFVMEINGKRIPDTHELIGWDRAGQKPVQWIFSPQGTGPGTWREIGDKAVLHWSLETKDGKLQGTSFLDKKDADTYTWQGKDITLGGTKLPDFPVVTYRRKTGLAAGDLWKAYREVAVGAWTGVATVLEDSQEGGLARGDELRGNFFLRPDIEGKALVGEMDFRAVDKPATGKSRVLVGWDPAARQVRLFGFWSGGTMEEVVLSSRQGSAFLGTYTARDVGRAPRQARIRFDYPDADSCVITFLDGPHKGKELSSWKRQTMPAQQPGPSASVAAPLKEYADLMVGEWECKECVPWGSVPGAGKVPARGICSWAAGGAALQWDLQIGDGQARMLACWDPVSKEIKGLGVGSTGVHYEIVIKKESGKWTTKAALTPVDGKQMEIRTVTSFDKGGDRHVNEYPTHQDVFTRVKK